MRVVFFLVFANFLLSCLSEPYEIENAEYLNPAPLYYALISNCDNVKVYHDSIYPIQDTLKGGYRKFFGGELRKQDKVFLLDTTELDKFSNIFNKSKTHTFFKPGDTIAFIKENIKGSCVLPDSALATIKFLSVQDSANKYTISFNIKINNSSQLKALSFGGFLFTDGKPSDLQLYKEMVPKIKNINFGAIVCCAAGHLADDSLLKELTSDVVHLDNADSATLKQFFKWVSETIEQGNKSQGTGESVALPPPPSEITLVL